MKIRHILVLVIVASISIWSCSSDDNDPPEFTENVVVEQPENEQEQEEEEEPAIVTTASIDGCASQGSFVKSLLLNKWRSVPDLVNMCGEDYRNTVIVEMENRSAETAQSISSLPDDEIVWFSLMYRYLIDSGLRTGEETKNMSLDDFRNTVIASNENNTEIPISELQGYNNIENLRIAYGWWLPQQHENLMAKLNDVSGSTSFFDLKDSGGNNMDVLRMVAVEGEEYKYLGVYHVNKGNGLFELWLAGANNLESWTPIIMLGERAHQGDIKRWGDGFIVAHEEDDGSSNNIRVKYYAGYSELITNTTSRNVALPRAFSQFAEGTPDIREMHGDPLGGSTILIGFHQFRDGDVDEQAFGVLKDFGSWFPWKDDVATANVRDMGFNGNIGGRIGFGHNEVDHVLLEAQGEKNAWETWRLLLGDGLFYTQLDIQTPKGSTSFANPGIADLGNKEFAVTSFLPTEGNQPGEIGSLLYKITL